MIKFRLLKDNMHTVRMICANEALRFLMGAPVVNVTLSHYPRIKVGESVGRIRKGVEADGN